MAMLYSPCHYIICILPLIRYAISLADSGKARGCSKNPFVIHSFINLFIDWLTDPLVPPALRGHHTQTFWDRSSIYKIDYFIVNKNFLNPEGHRHPSSGSKVTAVLQKGWILPIGGASSGRVCAFSQRSRLVLKEFTLQSYLFYVFPHQKVDILDSI